MKKLFTLTMMLMLVMGMSAQVKKTWDFTKGLSDETIENLNADASHWASNGTGEDGATNNWKNIGKPATDSYLLANGVVIPETEGLYFDIGSNKDNSIHLATTKMRLTRKSTKITFPKLANGQKITIVGRSANSTATNRGIAPVQSYLKLIDGTQTDGTCIFLGNQVEGSLGTYSFTWQVETDSPDSVDVQFQLTPDAGIDFTLFMIDEGDAPQVQEAQKVGYVYDSSMGSLDDDYAYIYLLGDSRFELTPMDIAQIDGVWYPEWESDMITNLRDFQSIVISPSIPNDNIGGIGIIKQVIAYVPTLNLNTNLYEPLGYGRAIDSGAKTLTVFDAENSMFEGLDLAEGLELLLDGSITGVELGDYFANDKVVATAGDMTAIHIHNPGRNAYMLLPLSIENMFNANQDVISQLIPQALQAVTDTKQEVKPVAKPVISTEFADGYTTVSISANHSNKIFYTLDGNDPTEQSLVYEGPFTVTQNTTVKTFGIGDGYTPSEIVEKEVIVKTQAATPVITVTREQGKSIVTFASSDEGTTVYYNFRNSGVIEESAVASEPVEITTPTTISAFVSGGDFLPSEVVSQFVGVDGIDNTTIRWDIMAHFDANADDWQGKGQQTNDAGEIVNANYFFTWGKNSGEYYDYNSVKEVVTGSEGQDSTIYNVLPPETYEAGGWIIKSRGQVMVWEKLDQKFDIGDTSYRNPDAAEDVIGVNDSIGITKNAVTFGKQPTDGPFNASLETTAKYAGPFDVIVYAGNGNEGEIPTMQIEVSADGENWTKLGDVNYSLIKRNWKRTKVSYEENSEVYVRILHTAAKSSGQIYDVYLMNNGEYSQTYSESALDAIATLQPVGNIIRTEVYGLDGTRRGTLTKGVNIVRQTYANGVVSTKKVLVK